MNQEDYDNAKDVLNKIAYKDKLKKQIDDNVNITPEQQEKIARYARLAKTQAIANFRKCDFSPKHIEFISDSMLDPLVDIEDIKISLDYAYKQGKLSEKDYHDLRLKTHKAQFGDKHKVDLNLQGQVELNFGINIDNFFPKQEKEEIINVK